MNKAQPHCCPSSEEEARQFMWLNEDSVSVDVDSFPTKSLKSLLVVDSGNSVTAATPLPASWPTLGSMGRIPRNGSLAISARALPPPLEKIQMKVKTPFLNLVVYLSQGNQDLASTHLQGIVLSLKSS
ncbi:unnamed protein product [Leptidea sinapis]|uniref:Uncharacterized protein n=1 Tax=Leptidea sinapis TaxID=189913 RepID=A0A5E4PKX7_9NEOP|nr:unnamed protein product [Leptidea sinapis]